MITLKVKVADLYKSLLKGSTAYFDLNHRTKDGSLILFKNLKESHIKNIIKLLEREKIDDWKIKITFDLVDFNDKGQVLRLVPNQIIEISDIMNEYYNHLIF